MIYATIIIGLIIVCAIVYNFMFRNNSNDSNINNNDKDTVKGINNNVKGNKTDIPKYISKKKVRNIKKYPAPRSMTETEKYLYSIKPNLQWWINTHGSKILNRTVQELKGHKLFIVYESNRIQN